MPENDIIFLEITQELYEELVEQHKKSRFRRLTVPMEMFLLPDGNRRAMRLKRMPDGRLGEFLPFLLTGE